MTIITKNVVPCPKCNGPLSGHTSLQGEAIPSIGDLTVCSWCGAILEYAEGMALEPLSDEDLKELAMLQPNEFAILMEGQQYYREQRSKKPN